MTQLLVIEIDLSDSCCMKLRQLEQMFAQHLDLHQSGHVPDWTGAVCCGVIATMALSMES